MNISGTHFNYYHVCRRKLWLFSNGISMEHTSDSVYEGKLIHENSYPQHPERYEEISVNGCKIDFYDTKNKVVHEIKKSDKMEKAHEWQVKYYIFALERNGIDGVKGLIEYPVLRHVTPVEHGNRQKRDCRNRKTNSLFGRIGAMSASCRYQNLQKLQLL